MPRKTIFSSDYDAAVRQGRSQGTGSSYRPGITVRDTASIATCTRLWSPKLGRVVHLLSNGETEAFLQFEWLNSVIDIREQFFLDPISTHEICRELNLIHPRFRGRDVVMTTDFLITRCKDGRTWLEAYQVKRGPEDLTPRTKAKLKIESLYWERRGVEWRVLFSKSFNPVLCSNLKRLHMWRSCALSAADAFRLVRLFLLARRCWPDARSNEIPHPGVGLESGEHLSFAQCIEVLAAHHGLEFPIREIKVDECPLALFEEARDAA